MFKKLPQAPPTLPLLITGAAGGLGRALAVEAARRGWPLLLTDRPGTAIDALAEALARTYGTKAAARCCDLTDSAGRARLLDGVSALGGLLNVAGVDFEGAFEELAPEEIQSIVRVNVEGTLDLTRRALALRNREQPFLLLTVSSLAAFYPMPVKATYAASKRFLLEFFRALRAELRGERVTVTVLCPAGLPTTPGAISGMARQGFWGRVTATQPGRVAAHALDCAQRGRFLVIPGLPSRLLRLLSVGIPAGLLAALIARRWRAARRAGAA